MKRDDQDKRAKREQASQRKAAARPDEFGLKPPRDRQATRGSRAATAGAVPMPAPPPEDEALITADEIDTKPHAWKGFEEENEPPPEFDFHAPKGEGEDEMDMTPMVDVTFLLLIFFMVTASFVTQRSISQPKPSDDLPSTTVVEMEDQNDYVEVIIDQNNTYRITSRDEEEIEAPSDPEMRGQMRNAKERLNARKLIVTAHEECWHEKVVKAWDYGTTLGFEEIEIKTTTQNY